MIIFWGDQKVKKMVRRVCLGVGLYLIHHLKGDTGGDKYLLRWILCCHVGRTLTELFMVVDENWMKNWAKIISGPRPIAFGSPIRL
jgi:hypothetical protein